MTFKMAAAAILNLSFLSILVTLSISGGSRLHYCKISFQSAAELLLFVQKSKMTAAAILNYNFATLDHPRSLFVLLKVPFKFRVLFNRDPKISQIWLKMPNQAPKIMFLGSFDPKHYFYHREFQKALPYAETRVLSHKWS